LPSSSTLLVVIGTCRANIVVDGMEPMYDGTIHMLQTKGTAITIISSVCLIGNAVAKSNTNRH
jgi:hypothetical protein